MKKGFTLVELLAVIVILALLATIAVPSAFSISESIKKNMYCEKVDMILSSAKNWGSSHLSQLKTDCYKEYPISYFIQEGVIKKETDDAEKGYLLNPLTNEKMDEKIVVLYKKNNRAYAYYKEGDTDENLSDCDAVQSVRACGSGEEEIQDNKVVCTKRPSTKCS